MSITQLFRVVRGRAGTFMLVLGGILATVTAASVLAPKQYVAEVSMVVDTQESDPLRENSLAPQLVPAHIATQIEIVRSRSVARKVIAALHLDTQPAVLAQYREETSRDDRGDIGEWLVGRVLDPLEVASSRNSNIIRIAYRSADPRRAATMANAFANAYMEERLELQVEPARRQAGWYEQQVVQLREELIAVQARLAAYQQEHGVLGVDDARIDVENGRLQEISNQLVTVQAAMYDAETRRAQIAPSAAADQGDALPDLQKSPVVQNLKSELARAEAKLAELSERYDLNHPQYRSAAAEVAALRSKLSAEVGIVRGSLAQSAAIARRQVAEVEAALEEQKNRLIALKQQRDQLTVLNRDVQSARAAYDAALAQANRTRLESRVDRTNVAILAPATAPLQPASPRLALNLLVAFCIGIVAALGLILTLELFDRRVRAAQDLVDFAGIPVLAELPGVPAMGRIGSHRRLRLQPTMT